MTFSIVARCEETGRFGVASTTGSICVGARCPWVRAGVGAVTTQHLTDPALGDAILDTMEKRGGSADEVEGGIDVKLVDLGTAFYVGHQQVHDIQTREYRCPEAIVGAWPYAHAADVWSLGCLVFEARGSND